MFGNLLIWFVVIPILMMAGLGICRNSSMNAIRAVMVTGSTVLLGFAIWLCVDFLGLRAAGETAEMLYQGSWMWYAPLNIHLAVGVDGISVLMILLSAIIVFAGTFASWTTKYRPLITSSQHQNLGNREQCANRCASANGSGARTAVRRGRARAEKAEIAARFGA